MRMLYKNCYQPTVTPCCGTVITHCAYVVCYFRDVYPFIYFITAMYLSLHHLGLYFILFRRFLISKINVTLQLTKLWLKKVTSLLLLLLLIQYRLLCFFEHVARASPQTSSLSGHWGVAPTTQLLEETTWTPSDQLAEGDWYWCTVSQHRDPLSHSATATLHHVARQ